MARKCIRGVVLFVALLAASLVHAAVPTATGVTISGNAEVGQLLTGSYTYNDLDGDLEGVSTFRWLRNGVPTGAVGTQYTLVNADLGALIVFEVTPVALTSTPLPGELVGFPALSAAAGPVVAANTAPSAINVAISGVASIGQTLTGSYTYQDADGDLENVAGTALRWLRNGTPIAGQAASTYVVALADVNTTLQFEVTPAAATGVSPGLAAASGGFLISNTAPSITGQATLATPEETGLAIMLDNLTVSDPDSSYPADFTLTVADGPNYTRVNNTITPVLNFNGDLSVPVTVNDGTSDSAVFNLVVTVTAVNDQPTVAGQLVLSTTEDSSITVLISDVIITDPDSAVFTLALQAGSNYTLAGNVVTPIENFSGNLIVPATVTDDSGAPNATSAPANLTITITAVNDFPAVLTPIPDQTAVEGSPFLLDVSSNFGDADFDSLTYSIGPGELPVSGNITFNGMTGVFSGTPTQADARDNNPYIINVTATDGQPGTVPAVDQFDLNISALDRANVSLEIAVTPDPAMLNDELRWTFNVRNAAGLQAAANVELSGSFIGTGLDVSSSSGCAIQAAAGQVTNFTCTVGAIPAGGATSVVLTTGTTVVGDVTAFAIAAGTLPVPIDPNLDDNSAQLAVGVADTFSNGAVQVLGSTNVLSVAAGDLNGDMIADLVVGTAAGQPVQIYLSGGFRDFLSSPITLADTGANEGIALADFDQNGAMDIVVANGGGQMDMVYANDGSANFSTMATLATSFSQDVDVGDFNDDGNPDIVFAAIGGNLIYGGNGNGSFTLRGSLGSENSHSVAVGQFDNDSNDDVAFANTGSASRVWVYVGGPANWFASRALLNIGDSVGVTAGSFGGDGQDDLAFARIPAAIGDVPANPVLINNGNGTFGAPMIFLGASPTNDIHSGDINNVDGANLDDLIFVNASGVHQIWVADNSGGFSLHGEQIADRDSFAAVVGHLGMTDVGDDGGEDVAMGGAIQSGVGIFLNDGFGNLGRGDAVAPTLTLNGDADVSVPAGTVYNDAGASAADNIDGDISASVVASGTVNSSVVGAYTITYNVADFAGNPAMPITRTVNVTPATGTGGGGGGGSVSIPFMAMILCLVLIAAFVRSLERNRNVQRAHFAQKAS